jgi:hypothetical protein
LPSKEFFRVLRRSKEIKHLLFDERKCQMSMLKVLHSDLTLFPSNYLREDFAASIIAIFLGAP